MASEPTLNFDENCKRVIVQNRTSPKRNINNVVLTNVNKTTVKRVFSATYVTIEKK